MVRKAALPLLLAAAAALAGCVHPEPLKRERPPARVVSKPKPQAKDYSRPLPPGAHALRKITDPRDRPSFDGVLRDRQGLLAAAERSLHYLGKPSSRGFFPQSGLSHHQVAASLAVTRELLASDRTDAEVAEELCRRFDVYTSVGCDDQGTVLFTGYYAPVFKASLEKDARFRFPLHRAPDWLVKDPRTGEILGRRRADGSLETTVPDRAALLASGELEGLELVWLENAFEAYIVGVQGSAFLELPDGRRFEVGYAGSNGQPYASLGQALIAAGKLKKDELSLPRLIAYFGEHEEELEPLSAANRRYVFFQETHGGPYGCLNEQVAALSSIATDKSIFPRGALCLIETKLPLPGTDPRGFYRGLCLDQDAGGAIRAPGRCDVFMGVGEEAGAIAGRTLSEGRLYYLILKDAELRAEG